MPDAAGPDIPCYVCTTDVVLECRLCELHSSIHSENESYHDASFVWTCGEEVEQADYATTEKPLFLMRRVEQLKNGLHPRTKQKEYVEAKRQVVAEGLNNPQPCQNLWQVKCAGIGDLPQLKETLEQKITTRQRQVHLKLMQNVWGAHVRTPEEDEELQVWICEPPRACLCCSRPSEIEQRDPLYAY